MIKEISYVVVGGRWVVVFNIDGTSHVLEPSIANLIGGMLMHAAAKAEASEPPKREDTNP